jgi:hypothetical protein
MLTTGDMINSHLAVGMGVTKPTHRNRSILSPFNRFNKFAGSCSRKKRRKGRVKKGAQKAIGLASAEN